jgi:hypothetical protein
MSRSLTHLRRGVFATAVACALGFGAAQAFGSATSSTAAVRTCPDKGFDYTYAACGIGCPGGHGYCAAGGICHCGFIP